MATKFELEGDNAVRPIIRKDIPHEALTVPGKMYDEGEVGRGSRTDRMLDEEVQGCISFVTGSRTATYTDKRFPMLDLWCIIIDHPGGWILV